MSPVTASQFMVLYTWFPVAVLGFMLLLIARFYRRFSSQRTLAVGFGVAVALYGAAAVRYALSDAPLGDGLGRALSTLAGLLLTVLSVRLAWQMLRSHPPRP